MSHDPYKTSIETYCGRYLSYVDPHPDSIELADIARGLAQTCRFAGQTTRYYSVAEHAVYVAETVARFYGDGAPDGVVLAALHHDSHEAFLGDWPTPLKNVIGDGYREIVAKLDDAIAHKFGFRPETFHDQAIRDADLAALRNEAATLKYSHGIGPHWQNTVVGLPLAGIGWEPDVAERQFLEAHERYSCALV